MSRHLLLLSASATLLMLAWPARAQEAPAPEQKPVVLDPLTVTGTKVPTPQSERFVIGAVIRAGARLELPKIAGVSHFLEHMMFRGSKRFPAAVYDSDTSWDWELLPGEPNPGPGPYAELRDRLARLEGAGASL